MLVMRVYFPYKAVLPKNLARVFRFNSIKTRFRIIWESESNQNTRMNIPTSQSALFAASLLQTVVVDLWQGASPPRPQSY